MRVKVIYGFCFLCIAMYTVELCVAETVKWVCYHNTLFFLQYV
jgi:hypothetical protein